MKLCAYTLAFFLIFALAGLIRLRLHVRMKTLLKRPEAEPWLTGPQVAKYYGVVPETVRRWRREGLPAYPRGYRLVHYRLSEVECWLKSRGEEGA